MKIGAYVGGGSGTGLTVAKHLLETHGRRIWAESDGEGQGSTFTFSLKIKNNESIPRKKQKRTSFLQGGVLSS